MTDEERKKPKRRWVDWCDVPEMNQLQHVCIGLTDLAQARQAAALALQNVGESDIQGGAVRVAAADIAVIRYCRVFSVNNFSTGQGYWKTALPSLALLNKYTNDERLTHQKFIDLRHTVTAHSDLEVKSVRIQQVRLPEMRWKVTSDHEYIDPSDLVKFSSMSDKLGAVLQPMLDDLADRNHASINPEMWPASQEIQLGKTIPPP